MSVHYTAVGWNRQKKRYDAAIAAVSGLYLLIFTGAGAWLHREATLETLLIRGLGTLALLMLHTVLGIGPLCRLDSRFLPLLYNRRHLGVATFLAGAGHGIFALVQFHALGDTNPLSSLLTGNPRFGSIAEFPFELLGFAALIILFLMAATSHDFWLHTLTPAVWKGLHMFVYLAYALLIAHVSWGVLQSETHPLLASIVAAGALVLCALHLAAARRDREDSRPCPAASIRENHGRVLTAGGARIAVFRHRGGLRAVSNVCRHQGGPLGEGRIVGGCITCPWHGYQYDPETGQSPPPFDDRIPVYETRVVDGNVVVNPCPR